MKTIYKSLTAVLLIGLSIFGILTLQKKSNRLKIGIIQIVEHEALDKARQGFIDEMKNLGYDADFDVQIAGGDISNLNSIAQKFANDKKDLVLAVSTPAAQSMSNATKIIPTLGTAITDFKIAGLVDSNEHPGRNISGTSDLGPVEKQIKLLKDLVPNCKKIGILYSSGEANSKLQAELAAKECKKWGLTSKDITVSNSSEVQSVLECNISDIDAIYLPTDNLIASCIPIISKITLNRKIPVVSWDADIVKKGALGYYTMNYYDLGKMTAHQADRILKKEVDIKDMPIEYQKNVKLIINEEIAKKLGINIPDELKGEL